MTLSTDSYGQIVISGNENEVYLQECDYEDFVVELEAVARRTWPKLFDDTRGVPDPAFKGWLLVHHEDGSTDMVRNG